MPSFQPSPCGRRHSVLHQACHLMRAGRHHRTPLSLTQPYSVVFLVCLVWLPNCLSYSSGTSGSGSGDALPPSLSLNTSSLSENVTTSGSERISLTQGEVRVFPQTASVISSDSDGLEIEITLHQPPDGLQEDMFLIVNPSRAVSVSSERSLVDNSFTLRLSGEANDSEYSQVLRSIRYRHSLISPSNTAMRHVTAFARAMPSILSNTITVQLSWLEDNPFPRAKPNSDSDFADIQTVGFTEGSSLPTLLAANIAFDYSGTFTSVRATLSATLNNGSTYQFTDGDGDRIFPLLQSPPQYEINATSERDLTFTANAGLTPLQWRQELFSKMVYTNPDAEPKYRLSNLEDGGTDVVINRQVIFSVTTQNHSQPISILAVDIALATINDKKPVLCAMCRNSNASCSSGASRRRRGVDESLAALKAEGLMDLFDRNERLKQAPAVKHVSAFSSTNGQLQPGATILVEFSADTNMPQLDAGAIPSIVIHPLVLNQLGFLSTWKDRRSLVLYRSFVTAENPLPDISAGDVSVEFPEWPSDGRSSSGCRHTVCISDGQSYAVSGKYRHGVRYDPLQLISSQTSSPAVKDESAAGTIAVPNKDHRQVHYESIADEESTYTVATDHDITNWWNDSDGQLLTQKKDYYIQSPLFLAFLAAGTVYFVWFVWSRARRPAERAFHAEVRRKARNNRRRKTSWKHPSQPPAMSSIEEADTDSGCTDAEDGVCFEGGHDQRVDKLSHAVMGLEETCAIPKDSNIQLSPSSVVCLDFPMSSAGHVVEVNCDDDVA